MTGKLVKAADNIVSGITTINQQVEKLGIPYLLCITGTNAG